MYSRSKYPHCATKPDCGDPKRVCQDMFSDYMAASLLLQQYPGRIIVIRYEELAMEPYEVSTRILKFLGHSAIEPIYEYLNHHTNKTDSLSDTYRVSSEVPFKWKNSMSFEAVHEIQEACKLAMNKWGYKMALNGTHLRSKDFYPLYDYTI
uniref:Sulfotransferase domain-containing protein n=1 Tax=Heliothis virescens TaxID=7102 RepID=A0A2A4IWE5_HELVI